MGNSVYILFYIVAALFLVFGGSALLFLHIRKKKSLRVKPALWALLFLAALVPVIPSRTLFCLKPFTDYSGGMRIEIHQEKEEAIPELYLTRETLSVSHTLCTGVLLIWLTSMTASFSFGISAYLNSLRFLTRHSKVCHDDRINRIFEQARKKAGVCRPVSLRLMDSGLRISPCTCGIVFPSIFIGRDYLNEYSDLWLELLILHELTHLRHHDPEWKLLTLAATSVYALLPVSFRIRSAVGEDTEYHCDAAVLELMGSGVRKDYISMIVDVAERNLHSEYRTDDLLSPVSSASQLLLKRYRNMLALKTGNRSGAAELFPLVVAAAVWNLAFFSAVTLVNPNDPGVDFASPMIEAAVCSYFDLEDSRNVTMSCLASIYSIEFERLEEEGGDRPLPTDVPGKGRYFVRCLINGGLLPGDGGGNPNSVDAGGYCRCETKVVDTRDLFLFHNLKTLIFSDKLESSEEAVWTDVPYAVIRRN